MLKFNKTVLFRCDASVSIGTGHVMRCITLANEAKQRGWYVYFVLRDPDENIVNLISLSGHKIQVLRSNNPEKNKNDEPSRYVDWLPVSQEKDAQDTLDCICEINPSWVVVDHYSLDATWHKIARKTHLKILVIDDLGDRKLSCDILLDQNLGANINKYQNKVLENCKLLLGPEFALLRDEFKEWRERSLKSRIGRKVDKILITMGGADPVNYTLKVLKELSKSKNAKHCEFVVIVGASYPHADTLNDFISFSHLKISVLSNVINMAEIMSSCDLCIGAAGSTSWERCCLGLPTIALAIAENQKEIGEQLGMKNLSIFSNMESFKNDFEQFFDLSGKDLRRDLSLESSAVCDGLGAARVMKYLEKSFEN